MLVSLVLVPVLTGLAVWALGDARPSLRAPLALGSLAVTVVLAGLAVADPASTTLRWGAGLELRLTVVDVSRAPLLLVPVVGFAVVAYALGYGEARGRGRMVGLLVAFVGAMDLLVLAGDLLTLVVGWELVGLVSWGLIAHHWRADGPEQAAHAFLATRAGDLGLFAAAGGLFAAAGTLDYQALDGLTGGWAHLVAAGVVLAAVAKSAQVPFSPWLFSAMAGPTPASALLHSATMVAAGAYLLARLHPFLDTVSWFAPVAIGVGLATALAGGVVAFLHADAKKLLAASTSAQYGFMFVAVGAGYPAVAIAHLVAHGLLKSLLFVSAGVAIDASGTEQLVGMRLGRRLPLVAGLTAVGALALAAVPPVGAAWTKEWVVAAATHQRAWIGVLTLGAGGLSVLYAARFQFVAYGPSPAARPGADSETPSVTVRRRPGAVAALGLLALGTVVLGAVRTGWGEELLLDVIGGHLPPVATWEQIVALAGVVVGVYATILADRRGLLAAPATTGLLHGVANWWGIPGLSRRIVVDPMLSLAAVAARFDDRVVDAGVRGAAGLGRRLATVLATGDDRVVDAGVRGTARAAGWLSRMSDRVGEWTFDGAVEGLARLTGAAGRDGRRLQSGQTHHYYTGLVAGLALLVLASVLWR